MIDPEVQGIPLTNGSSGVRNLAYITSFSNLERHFETFRDIVDFHNLAMLVTASTIEAVPEIHERSVRIGRELGLEEKICERLYLTGLLHDVGKIGVADSVLRKSGKLTAEEFEQIKQHPDKGWAILCDLEQLRYVLPGVLSHHERFDGKGYPDGLSGESIPLDGRILAVCDAYDAMTSDRPYRAGISQEMTEEEFRNGSGSQWDPRMVQAFFRAMPDIIRLRETYRPKPQPRRKN